jgi:PAS domain-containing protein
VERPHYDLAVVETGYGFDRLRQAIVTPQDQNNQLALQLLKGLEADVTALRLAQEELHQQYQDVLAGQRFAEHSQQRLAHIIHVLADGYIVTDSAGRMEEISRGAMDLLHLDAQVHPRVLAGQPITLLLSSPGRRTVRRFLEGLQHLGPDDVAELHAELAGRGGTRTPVSFTVVHSPHWDKGNLYWLLHRRPTRQHCEESQP